MTEKSEGSSQTGSSAEHSAALEAEQGLKEANQVIAIGGAVGAAGIGATILLGATCPVCYVAAPGLIGLGIYRRWRCKSGAPIR